MKLLFAAFLGLFLVGPIRSAEQSWLFDDFESTGRVSAHALSWVVLGDDLLGGASSAALERVPGGANASGHALRVTGSVAEVPSAFTGVWAPLDTAGRPVDLGAFDALRFVARGEGTFRVGLRSGPPTGMANFMAPFTAGPEWKAVEIGFDALAASGPGSSGAHWEPREVHWLGFSTAPGAQGRFQLELDDVQLVSHRTGVAAVPVTQPGTPRVISVALAEAPAQGAWRELAQDPAGDGKMPSLPDAVSVSVTTDAPDGRIWFRIGLRETPPVPWLGLNLALDVDGDPTDGTPWWGVNTGFRFDRLVSVWLFKAGSGYQGVAGTADAAAVAKGDFMAGARDLRVAVERGSPAFLVGVPRSVLGTGAGVLRFVAAVGSALAHNDDLPDTGALVLPRWGRRGTFATRVGRDENRVTESMGKDTGSELAIHSRASGERGRLPIQERPGRSWRRAAGAIIYAAAWLPYLAVYVVVFLASGASPGDSLRGAVANVLPEAALGALVLRLPARLPWPEGRRGPFLARQAGLAAAFSVASTAGKLLLITLDRARLASAAWSAHFDLRIVPWQLFVSLLVYLTLAGVVYALANAERVRREAARAARAEALQAQAELAALRAQLNPHFLLNTLHSVLGLVAREPTAAEAALERLGDLLHYALRVHRGRLDQVGFREEWDFVCSYLDLEKLRLGERLRVSLAADPEVFAGVVPPFCLQPLVENAVRHAVVPRAEGGCVTVEARRTGPDIRLEVRDDGPGRIASEGEEGGLGLRIVEERLAVLYRGQAAFHAESPREGGYRVRLSIPAHGLPDEAD